MVDYPLTPRQKSLLISLAQAIKKGLGTSLIVARSASGISVIFSGGKKDMPKPDGWDEVTEADFAKLTEIGLLYVTKSGKYGPTNYTLNEYEIDKMAEELQHSINKGTAEGTQNPKKVFVVHGRNLKAKDALWTFLHSIGLQPIEWEQAVRTTRTGSPYIGDVVDAAFSEFPQAIIVLMTPDDVVILHPALQNPNDPSHETQFVGQARPNVIFEAGKALTLFPNETIFVELGTVRPFTDIDGRLRIRLDNSTQKRQDLALRLRSVGCAISDLTESTYWHKAGNVDIDNESVSIEELFTPVSMRRWRVAENELIGDAGWRSGNAAWEIDTPDIQGRGIYGPYTTLSPAKYRVTYRLKIDDNIGDDDRLAIIDVTARRARKHLAIYTLTVGDFVHSNQYQDFNLDFTLLKQEEDVEFRIRTNTKFKARRRLTFDYVDIKRWKA